MGIYVTVDDVAARYEHTLPSSRHERVATLIEDAEAVLHSEVPGLDARVADGRVAEATIKRVTCAMVLAVLRNPAGFSSQTAGEFSYSYQGGGTTAGGRLELSAADKRALLGPRRAQTLPMADDALRYPLRPVPR